MTASHFTGIIYHRRYTKKHVGTCSTVMASGHLTGRRCKIDHTILISIEDTIESANATHPPVTKTTDNATVHNGQ